MTPHDFCGQGGRTEAELLHGLLFRGPKLNNGLGVLLGIQRPCFIAQACQMAHEFLKVLDHVLLLRHVFPEVELTKISIAWILKVLLHAVHDVLNPAERFDEAVADRTQDLICSELTNGIIMNKEDTNNKGNENKN